MSKLLAPVPDTTAPDISVVIPLLNEAETREQHRDAVNWPLVDSLVASGIGGVRMEDNILITDGAPENLTGMISCTMR